MFKKHRRLTIYLIGVMFLFIAAAIALPPRPRYAVWGFIRGDNFYDGWPTSYYHDLFVEKPQTNRAPWAFGRLLDRVKDALGISNLNPSIQTLPLLKGDPQSLAVLQSMLEDESFNVRMAACNGICNVADHARHRGTEVSDLRTSIPRLIELLRSDKECATAAKTLGAIGADAKEAVPALESLLAVKNGFTRVYVAEGLCFIDAENVGALNVLIDALNSPDGWTHRNAINGLYGYVRNHGITAKIKQHTQALIYRLRELPSFGNDQEQISSLLSSLEGATESERNTPQPRRTP